MMKYISVALLFITLLACESSTDKNIHQGDSTPIVRVSSGKVERITNIGAPLVPPRTVDVWLPEGYQTDKRYAVLYMHDGQMLFDTTHTWNKQEWGVDEAMTTLLQANKIRPTIVVGVWNADRNRHAEYFPQQPFEQLPKPIQDSLMATNRSEDTPLFAVPVYSDKYLAFLVDTLKPLIDQRYSTLPDAANTFIAGSSMGGLISMYAVCEYPQVFRGAACLSTHWLGSFSNEDNPIPEQFMNYLSSHIPESNAHRFYFDYGTATLDAFYEPFQLQADSIFRKKGYDDAHYNSLKFEGADHSENAWRERLVIPLEFLLKE